VSSVNVRVHPQAAFKRLLEWLDDGVDSQGERYLEMRLRLVAYFDRRNAPAAEDLADETFNRISRTLEQEGAIATRPPARYCYVIARFVLLENFRRERKYVHLDEWRTTGAGRATTLKLVESGEVVVAREQRLDCLDRCLDALKPSQREMVLEYYRDVRQEKIERRHNLASRLGITMNALGIRVCRIRDNLAACVRGCGPARRTHKHV
jgi:DNA-directed RNA polymerase specialized sigma24 family protein